MDFSLFNQYVAKEIAPIENAVNNALINLPESAARIAAHILGAGGKRLRPLLAVLCSRMLGYDKDDIYMLAASMEYLHAATLLHDDVLDNADMRRGRTSAHLVFGSVKTILAGDAMLALGNRIVAGFGRPELAEAYSQATMETAAGEIMEIDSLKNPALSQKDYLAIARGKTACLIAQSCAIGAIIANAQKKDLEACLEYGENLGLAFQIVDDALDFAQNTGKPAGGDLREGKMTPPVFLYRQSLAEPQKKDFDEKFKKNGFNAQETEELIEKIAAYSSQVREMAKSHLKASLNALEKLPQGKENDVLRQMAQFVGARSA